MASSMITQHLIIGVLFFLGAALSVQAQELSCPEVPPDEVGPCVDLCQPGDTTCAAGELCCSNGCGHECTLALVTKRRLPNSGIFAIDDVYVILIGMACVVVLLFVIIILTLCCYASRTNNNNDFSKH